MMATETTNVIVESLIPEEKVPTITDILALNDDCLMKVFEYLSENELLNVIQTNTRFKLPCQQFFKRRYCRNPITVSNVDISGVKSDAQLKYSVKILKHFGAVISKLRVQFKADKIGGLLDAIVANCDTDVAELEFEHLGTRVKVNSLPYKIGNCRMRTFLANLAIQFKNLRKLKFDYWNKWKECQYSNAIVQNIPSLLSFSTNEFAAGQLWPETKLREFIGLNPQLEHLSILFEVNEQESTDRSWHITKSFIRHLDDSLPLLKCLEINRVSLLSLPKYVPSPFSIFDFRTENEPPVDQFPNLKELTFGCFPEFYGIDFGFLMFRSRTVEVLRLSYFDYNIHYFIMHVSQFTSLKILELEMPLNHFANLLGQNRLVDAVWRPNGIREIILNNCHLTKIVVRQHPCEAYDGFHVGTLAAETAYWDAIRELGWKMCYGLDCLMFEKLSTSK